MQRNDVMFLMVKAPSSHTGKLVCYHPKLGVEGAGKLEIVNEVYVHTSDGKPLWQLTDDVSCAAHDPGFLAGEDLSMIMMMQLNKSIGECLTFTPCTPTEEDFLKWNKESPV